MPITLDGTLGITTPALTTGSLTNTGAESIGGNLTFSSTGQRIIGDMSASGASVANRLYFQNSVSNAGSSVGAIPNGTGTTSNFRAVNNSDPTNSAYIMMAASTTEMQFNSGILGTGSYLPMTFYTGGSERMRIDTSGNVGIGTTTMTGKLNIIGGASYWGFTTAQGYLSYSSGEPLIGAVAGQGFRFYSNNVEAMRLDTSGNLGIGISSPSGKLHVYGNTNAVFPSILQNASNGSSAYTTLWFGNDQGANVNGIFTNSSTNTVYGGTNSLNILTVLASPITFNTNNTERMRILSGGYVGIGTTTPNSPLEVYVTRTSSTNATSITLSDNVTGAQTNGVYKSIRSTSNGGNSVSEIRFIETDGTNNNTGIGFATEAAAGGLTERMRIGPTGAIGLSGANYGTANQVLTSAGSASAPTWTNQAVVPVQVVNLSGLSSATFVINAYPSYIVYFDCISGTTTGANFQLKASYDGGSTYPSVWNYREVIWDVNGSFSSNNGNTGNSAQAWLFTNTWDGAGTPGTAGTGGFIKIQGCGAYWGVNKRVTFEGEFGGQSPSGQQVSLCMGQTQDDSHQYNVVQVSLSAGTFKAQARMLVCGVNNA